MNKKLLVSVFLCFFVFSSVVLAQEKAKAIEHIVWAEAPYWELSYTFFPDNFTLVERFESDPFLIFHVPASKKGETLFFDIFTQAILEFTNHHERVARASVLLRIISDIIPEDFEFINSATVIVIEETNNAGNYDTTGRRSERTIKLIMRSDNVG